MSEVAARGRPPVSSRDILQDAAFDLFLERSYAQTSVADITQRAGVSRATFFNYFSSKSDVFWVELDDALDRFRIELGAPSSPGLVKEPAAGVRAVLAGLDTLAAQLGDTTVPFALTQFELIGSVGELQASALARFSRLAGDIAAVLERSGFPPARARTASYAIVAAAISAAQEWADAGTRRGPLRDYLSQAVSPIAEALSREVASWSSAQPR